MRAKRSLISLLATGFLLLAGQAQAVSLTTLFAGGNGQAGNMFDLNVLATDGIQLESIDLNLDSGTWNLELYSVGSSYVGLETTPGAWTLRDSTSGITSAGAGLATTWDFSDFLLSGGGVSALYVRVTNGTALNYTNGAFGSEGSVAASDANLEILVGTGNAGSFGRQYRPRIWNGTLDYSVVPEPTTALLMALGLAGLASVGRRETASF